VQLKQQQQTLLLQLRPIVDKIRDVEGLQSQRLQLIHTKKSGLFVVKEFK